MSVPTEIVPPLLVRRSLTCSQRPSAICRSKVCASWWFFGLGMRFSLTGERISALTASRGVPVATASAGRPLYSWNLVLQSTSRSSASHSAKDSVVFSIAARRLSLAISFSAASRCCSVTSTAMPIRWTPVEPFSTSSVRMRIQRKWPSAWRIRNNWSTRRISCAAARLASSNRSMSSGWISALTSPKDRMSSQAS